MAQATEPMVRITIEIPSEIAEWLDNLRAPSRISRGAQVRVILASVRRVNQEKQR